MNFYFPDHRLLCMAENATHTLHNLLTLRGALVRDPHVWAGYLTEAIDLFGRRPRRRLRLPPLADLGTRARRRFLSQQRDLYGYLHDQTLRLMNQGYTAPRSPSRSSCRRRWRGRGTPAATTARSATTSRPSTSGTWAGSTATPPTCGSTRPSSRPRATSSSWAARTPCWPRPGVVRRGRLPLGGHVVNHVVFADPTNAAARDLQAAPRTARLRRRERHLAELLPHRRHRAS